MDLMQHQKEGVQFLSNKRGAGLFFDPGLGKTLTVLSHLQNLKDQGHDIFPTLIIAPLSVVPVWGNEVRKFGFPFSVKELTGTRAQRISTLKSSKEDIIVINYEGARIIPVELKDKEFKTVILDESHRAKSRTAQQTKVCLDLGYQAIYRIILSGTPVTKSPEDLWTQIQFLQQGYLGNFYAFKNRYVESRKMTVKGNGGYREIQVPYKFKNLKELNIRVDALCLRKEMASCLDLPEKIYKRINCPMSAEQKNHYLAIQYGLQTEIATGTITVKSALIQIQKLAQIAQGFIYTEKGVFRFKDNGKIQMLKDVFEDLFGKKVVLLCHFKEDLDFLAKELTKAGTNFITFAGDAGHRGEAVEQFQSPEGPMVFLSTIGKAKEGITLTEAHHVIYYGNSYSYEERYQSEGRCHRKGQKNSVVYYDFVAPGTIDERIIDILTTKKEMAAKILGDALGIAKIAAMDGGLSV